MAWNAIDNFDSYTNGGALVGANGGTGWGGAYVDDGHASGTTSTTATAPAGGQGGIAAKLVSSSSGGVQITRLVSSGGPYTSGSASFQIQVSGTTSSFYSQFYFSNSANQGGGVNTNRFGINLNNPAGDIAATDGQSYATSLGSISANTWINVTVQWAAGVFQVSVNGGAFSGNFNMGGGTASVDQIYISSVGSSSVCTLWVDNITYPNVPTTISTSDTSAVSDTPAIEIVLEINVTDQTAMSESYGIGTPIKFDNAASFSNLVSSISGTYTTAGTNRALVAFVYSVTVPFSINPPTYNGVVMENVAEIQLPAGYSGFLAAYYLPNPAVGANTFAVSASGVAGALYASVMSYDSVSPDSDIDDFAFSTALLVNSITETLTSDLNGEWDFLGVVSGLAATLSAGAGSTLRTNVSPLAAFDSNGSVGPANTTYSMTANSSSSVDGLAAIMFSLEPYIWFQSKPSILLSEDIFVLDAPTLEIISSISVSDSTAVSDTPTIAIIPAPFNVNVSDSTAVSDTPTIQKILLISVSDFTPSSGPNYPTSGANQTGVGTIAWTNPNNIIFGSGSFAFVTLVSCFIAGTLITTPNGFKTIETIQNGDEIIADDGTIVKVKVTFVHRASSYLKIKTAKYSIGTTGNHPFLTPSGQVRAGELKMGDSVFTTDGVDTIESIINIPDTVDVYDLTVEDPHTYIADGFFVHNKP